MNKKILLGMSFGGIAGIFCACGSGDILKSSYELGDATMATVTSEDSTVYGVKTAVLKENCPQCLEAAPSSSSVAVRSATSSFTPPPTMSSANTYAPSSSIVINLSSDSGPLFGASSATLPPVASSSSISVPATPGNEMGTCAPNPATVNRDEKVTWKFTRANGVAVGVITNAAFEWTFEGGTPATAAGSGASGINVSNVTYAASGQHTASVLMKTTDGEYNIACSPVQVNGAPITGCKCALASEIVDVAVDGTATWNVTGCTSAGANITSYTWTGATGATTSASTALAAKGDIGAAKVAVANDDNTVVEVECPSVKAIDSRIPDYIIEKNQLDGAVKLPAGLTSVKMDVSGLGGMSCTIFCQTEYTPELQGALTMKVGTQSAKGNFNVTVSGLPLESCSGGTMLDFELSAPATCGVQ